MPSAARSRAPRLVALATSAVLGTAALAALPTQIATAAPVAVRADVSPTTLPGGLDLTDASIEELQAGLTAGDFTSVELTEAYLARIAAIDRDGPGLNAIRALSQTALDQAAAADAVRAAGDAEGPLFGVPLLLKDNIDVAGMPTTAGSVALADSIPATDAPLTASLREAGAIILGKTNLTEFANFTTSGMPSGYSSLGGQVLNAYDLSQTPSGSSAGSGVAGSTSMAAGTVGTETSGSILSPANANSLVGIKPTVGLISRTGVIPISATQDTAGPMTRSVYDAAAVLTGLTTGADPEDPATADRADEFDDVDYTASVDDTALEGVRLGVISSNNEVYNTALGVLEDQGAILVPVSSPVNTTQPSILTWEFKRDLNAYLDRLPDDAPMTTLADVIAFNDANPAMALKFGQSLLTASEAVDLDDPAQMAAYTTARDQGLADTQGSIDGVLESNEVEAIVSNAGTTGVGARAGYPSITVPAGYAGANRRPSPITFLGTAYSEQALIGFASDYEAAADVRRSPQQINPTAFACTPLAPEGVVCDEPEEPVEPTPPTPPARSATVAALVRNPVVLGQSGVVKVKVAAGSMVPGGRVVVTTGDGRLGAGTLDGTGAARITLKQQRVGRKPLVVRYLGTPTVRPSQDRLSIRVVRSR